MTHTASVWLLLAIALLSANLPFVNNRLLLLIPRGTPKSWLVHGAELLFFYLLVGVVGLSLEHAAGQIYPQGWEFYATTLALFLTLSFPGFVYRYLFKKRH